MQPHKQRVTILITAGHAATTALATIEELKSDPSHNWDIHWIGPQKSLEGTSFPPFELGLFPKLGVTVHSISAGKLQSKFTRQTIPALLKVPQGFIQSLRLLRTIRPQVILSFGGFAALPVVVAAWVMRIPVVLHEQTVAAGLANQVSSYFVAKIALARQESREYFAKHKSISRKCVVVGNPLSKEILSTKSTHTLPVKPLIYVTGGSRGAQRINTQILRLLPELLPSYRVIHQTGQLDFQKAEEIRSKLPSKLQKSYEVHAFINPLTMKEIYSKADIIVARSGANTVSEVLYLHIPTIFIPIPWSRSDEQTKNALYAQKLGVGYLLPESQLSAETLLKSIKHVHKNWTKMKNRKLDMRVDDSLAASRLVAILTKLLP